MYNFIQIAPLVNLPANSNNTTNPRNICRRAITAGTSKRFVNDQVNFLTTDT